MAHIMASCMGGIRTAGDLVAWMQLTRRMRIHEAKRYVADRLGVAVFELTDEEIMREVRKDLELGTVTSIAGGPKGIRAKWRVAELLDVPIRSVALFKTQVGMGRGRS